MHSDIAIELRVFRALADRTKSEWALRLDQITLDNIRGNEVRAGEYDDAAKFAVDWCLYNLLRKWTGWDTSSIAYDAAIGTWKQAEEICFQTNQKLRQLEPHLRGGALTSIRKIRRKIRSVLGDDVPFDWLIKHCRWSGGATFAHKRGVSSFDKHKGLLDCTPRAIPIVRSFITDDILRQLHHGDELRFEAVKGNRCAVVPKDATTDRTIGIEPSGNAFVQQALGAWIRKRLRRVGIDLDNQGNNQKAAFEALVDGYATIDMSMASDTLAISVVELLLPPAWTKVLSDLRSPFTFVEGKWRLLEKFSSMGNAYTFELESLIFWAISSAFSNFTLVYGDDIIVDQKSASDVIEVLRFFGFVLNESKSFTSGLFYESCGKHYFNLEDVTPCYQKELCTNLSSYIKFHNRLIRWGSRTGNLPNVQRACRIIRDDAKRRFKQLSFKWPAIPYGSPGDEGFLTPAEFVPTDRNGDFRCIGWVRFEDKVPVTGPISNRAAYSLALRETMGGRKTYSGDEKGRAFRTGKAHWKMRKIRIWHSSLEPTGL